LFELGSVCVFAAPFYISLGLNSISLEGVAALYEKIFIGLPGV
jgi:hypothetical protein